MIKLRNILNEELVQDTDFLNFAGNRLGGATKIAQTAKAKKGELDIDTAKKEFIETLGKISLNMDQTTFQIEVGRLEVLGELFIKNK